MKLLTGMTATRQALLEPSTATGTIVYWSSDPVVATVSGTDKVTAGNLGVNDDIDIRTGKSTIYALYQGNPSIVDEYEVAVSNAPTLIAFRPESLEIGIGETLEFGKDINVNFPGEGDELYDIEPPLTFSNKSTAALTLTTSGGVTKVTARLCPALPLCGHEQMCYCNAGPSVGKLYKSLLSTAALSVK